METSMFDRRLVTDVALAALIAFPAVLPASHGMRSAIVESASAPAAIQLADAGPQQLRWDLAPGS
jgi:hypothetical protein